MIDTILAQDAARGRRQSSLSFVSSFRHAMEQSSRTEVHESRGELGMESTSCLEDLILVADFLGRSREIVSHTLPFTLFDSCRSFVVVNTVNCLAYSMISLS